MDREDEDDAGAPEAMVGRDLLGRQAIVQRNWALQAVADVRALVSGAGVRADCLECRGYGAPRVAKADERGLAALLLGLWRRSEEHTSELQTLLRHSYASC